VGPEVGAVVGLVVGPDEGLALGLGEGDGLGDGLGLGDGEGLGDGLAVGVGLGVGCGVGVATGAPGPMLRHSNARTRTTAPMTATISQMVVSPPLAPDPAGGVAAAGGVGSVIGGDALDRLA
jgi:hypothetical protein